MDKFSELKKRFRELIDFKNSLPILATVVAVDGVVCTVQINDTLKITDVKLRATSDESDNELLVIPKVKTNVLLLSLTGELDNLTIVKIDEVEKIIYKQDGLEILADGSDQKVSIKNKEKSLLELFQDLKTIIEGITVSTGVGPSGTPLPPTIQALTQFETDFKNLLK